VAENIEIEIYEQQQNKHRQFCTATRYSPLFFTVRKSVCLSVCLSVCVSVTDIVG